MNFEVQDSQGFCRRIANLLLDLCCVFANDTSSLQHMPFTGRSRAMRTNRTSLGRWMGALGTGLALPFFSLPAQATPSASADALRAAADTSVMARWHDYARSSIRSFGCTKINSNRRCKTYRSAKDRKKHFCRRPIW